MQNSKGFTIIELLIAMGVMALTIPSLTISLLNLTTINNRSRDLALANIIISNKAEQIRSSGFNSLSATTTDFSSELPAELASPKNASYTVTMPSSSIANITFTINYKDYNKTKTLTYKTIVSELGVGQ
ncbi:type II secretion system protein [Candidatus Saccharibacteria bacterium]|nr:type II secretion system protein [Candidatus Saccharibacteria bacterium]MBI3338217.1 type II secretion system protein [Candidatus Saccharibacteria bacterium]